MATTTLNALNSAQLQALSQQIKQQSVAGLASSFTNALYNGLGNSTVAQWYSNSGQSTSATISAYNTYTTIPTGSITTQGLQVLYQTPKDIRPDGQPHTIYLADGAILKMDGNGNYTIEDKDAKIIYKGCPVRDFNSYINASDKLEEFIKFCGTVGVKQDDMFKIPIESFIQWLVIEAARADGEKTETLALPNYSKPRCTCGRFLKRKYKQSGINHCRPVCFEAAIKNLK
jgi:hypothetical protein